MAPDLHIAELRSRVRIAGATRERAVHLAQRAETELIHRALMHLERELETRLGRPNAVIRIRELRTRLRLRGTELSQERAAKCLAQDLAEHVLSKLRPGSERPPASHDDDIVCFADETDELLAATLATARGEPLHWFDEHLRSNRHPWELLVEKGPDAIAHALSHAADRGVLTELREHLRAARLDTTAVHLPTTPRRPATPAETRQARPRVRTPELGSERSNEAATRAAELDASARVAMRAAPVALHEAVECPGRERTTGSRTQSDPVGDRLADPSELPVSISPGRASTQIRSDPLDDATTERAFQLLAGGAATPLRVLEGRVGNVPESLTPDGGVATRYAGVFYLIRPILELELAEHLWEAGLREGAFLAHAVLALLGGDAIDDPAIYLFGGLPLGELPELDPVPAWVAEELRAKAVRWLRRNLERRRRSLDVESLEGGVEAHARRLESGLACIDPCARRVSARAGATILLYLQTAIGDTLAVDSLRNHLRVSARVLVGADDIEVIIPIEEVDIRLRRRALDQTPGYVPWLRRRLMITFAGGGNW